MPDHTHSDLGKLPQARRTGLGPPPRVLLRQVKTRTIYHGRSTLRNGGGHRKIVRMKQSIAKLRQPEHSYHNFPYDQWHQHERIQPNVLQPRKVVLIQCYYLTEVFSRLRQQLRDSTSEHPARTQFVADARSVNVQQFPNCA